MGSDRDSDRDADRGSDRRRGFPPTSFGRGLPGPPARADQREPSPADLDATLDSLRRALAGIAAVPDAWLLARRRDRDRDQDRPRGPADEAEVAVEGRLLRGSLRAILASSTLASLDDRQRADARVQAQIDALVPEVDATLLATLERLDALDPEQLASLDQRTREPGFLDQAAADLDAMASELGVAAEPRARLRGMVEHLRWRLERAPLSALLAELLATLDAALDKWATRLPALALEPAYAGLPTRWHSEHHDDALALGEAACDPSPTSLVPTEVALAPLDNPHGLRWARRGRRATLTGVGLSLLGLAIGQLEFLPGAFTVTAGVVVLVVGVVMWIYGELRR